MLGKELPVGFGTFRRKCQWKSIFGTFNTLQSSTSAVPEELTIGLCGLERGFDLLQVCFQWAVLIAAVP